MIHWRYLRKRKLLLLCVILKTMITFIKWKYTLIYQYYNWIKLIQLPWVQNFTNRNVVAFKIFLNIVHTIFRWIFESRFCKCVICDDKIAKFYHEILFSHFIFSLMNCQNVNFWHLRNCVIFTLHRCFFFTHSWLQDV